VGAVKRKVRRELALALLGYGLAAALAAGAVLAWPETAAGESGTTRGLPPDVPLAADNSLGTNIDLSRLDASERQRVLATMEACGFLWLRQRFPWDVIEVEQGVFEWAVWDEIVEEVRGHNLNLIAVLDTSPGWSRVGEDMGNPLAPPAETRDFGDFASAFAARYGDRVDHYQVWDEPNIAPHWGAREIDPVAYARLLREGAIRIRAVDPDSTILTAALAPNVEPGGANMSELLFLDALYQQDAAEWFDIVAVQSYRFDDPLDASPRPDRLNWRRAALLREVMEAHGDTSTAAWMVSFGWLEATERMIVDAMETARSNWPWVGPMLWAAWSPGDIHGEYALVEPDGHLAPLADALCTLAVAPAIAWPGVYQPDHPSARYEGNWRVTPSGADNGGSGDQLQVPFRGTRLDLAVRRGDYRAFLFVSVDGRPANALPRDAEGRAYVVLYDPSGETSTVTVASDLVDGRHVAEIVAERGWGQWALAGWRVSRQVSDTNYWWLPLGLGLAAVMTLGATVYKTWPDRFLLLDTCSSLLSCYLGLDERWMLILTGGAAILVYVTVGTVPGLVALGLLAGLLFLSPKMGLPLIALALPFYQLGKPLLGRVFSMVEILTLLTAAGWLGRWVLGRREQGLNAGERRSGNQGRGVSIAHYLSHFTALDWGVIALICAGALSLVSSEHLREAAREFRTVVFEAGVFYGLLRAMIQRRSDIWRVTDAWVLGAALIAAVGVCQWALGQNLITADEVWRVRGFYGSPNNLALYLGRVFPLCVAIAVWGPAPIPRSQLRVAARAKECGLPGLHRKWVYGVAMVVVAAALLLTYSRGAWLLGVPVALLFLAAMRGRRTFAIALGVLAIVAVALVLVVGAGRLTSLLETTEGTTFFRLQLWQSSWAMIRDHPVQGVGLDNFLYAYRSHYVLPTAWEEFNLSHPHNLLFDFWLRLGLSGLVVLIWLLVSFFRQGWRSYRSLPQGTARLLLLGLMGGMVNFVAHGLVDNAFFLVDLGFVFTFMLAIVQAPQTGKAQNHSGFGAFVERCQVCGS
jgi:O-antigen ligase